MIQIVEGEIISYTAAAEGLYLQGFFPAGAKCELGGAVYCH